MPGPSWNRRDGIAAALIAAAAASVATSASYWSARAESPGGAFTLSVEQPAVSATVRATLAPERLDDSVELLSVRLAVLGNLSTSDDGYALEVDSASFSSTEDTVTLTIEGSATAETLSGGLSGGALSLYAEGGEVHCDGGEGCVVTWDVTFALDGAAEVSGSWGATVYAEGPDGSAGAFGDATTLTIEIE